MDCLVTKLKGSVNDLTIPKLGSFIFKGYSGETESTGRNYVHLVYEGEGTVSMEKGNILELTTGEKSGNKLIGPDLTFYIAQGDFVFNVEKYNLRLFHIYYNDMSEGSSLNTKDFQYCSKIKRLEVHGIKGDLSDLARITTLEYFDSESYKDTDYLIGDIKTFVSNKNITSINMGGNTMIEGDIASLGSLTKLRTFKLAGTKISGNIEDFVRAQRTAGRTEATMDNLPYLGACRGLRFNGNAITNQETNTLSWTSTTITLNGQQITA